MRIRFAFAALIVFAACLSGTSATTAELTVQTVHLDRKSTNYEIAMLYPRTGVAAIDAQIAAWAKAQADFFAAGAAREDRQNTTDSLDVSYTIIRNDGEMFEALFEFDSFTGGAHPNHELHTLNFLLPDGARLYLAEIVGIAGIPKVSELATENLIKELTEEDPHSSNVDSIRSGTAVRPGVFETFSLTKDALVLYFSDYEVAPYAAGPQRTEIPLAKLRRVLRDDWRAPQPSFDCDDASTAVEKGLCADVTAARLDRDLAEAYHWEVRLAETSADKTRARDAQRAFLSQRDAACGAQARDAMAQCLRSAYEERLKAFHRQPN